MSRSRARGALVFPLAISFALGCGLVAPRFHLAEDAPKSGDFSRVVLLPMNFEHSPRASLAPGTELMGERIRSYLEASGYQVVVPRMSDTLALWKQSVQAVGGITDESGEALDKERYARARSELVRGTLASIPADGVVAATVLARPGRYVGMDLSWDGAMRPMPIDMGNTNVPVMKLNGKDLGTSLRTSVFDRDGRNVFERYVGLEPMRRIRVVDGRVKLEERKDLFQNEALIASGIALSFQPWLVPAAAEAK
jgi:hypothetical protein